MNQQHEVPAMPDPAEIFAAFTAFHRTGALKAAIELDLFSALGAGATTADELARRCGATPRGVRILADFLTAAGFLAKDGARYALTPTTATFLDRASPAFMGSAITFLTAPMMWESFANVTAAVRKGGTVAPEDGVVAAENPMWVEFARAMAPPATFAARLLAIMLEAAKAPRWKVLDIAAGHGMFGITLAQENPNAQIVALDWANVLTVAEENARAAGVQDRFRTIKGNAFEVDLGSGYDLVLLPNFLHHFDVATCEALLRRVHAALATGGRAVTVDFIPDESRTTPVVAASFALVMLIGTPAGDAYTFTELERMFRNAGFATSELRELPPSFQRAVVSYKAS
jgi:2-polyprenyl-3-methyl-5-hydroxy-6-metoxy-1,4-benzoquinol methylase